MYATITNVGGRKIGLLYIMLELFYYLSRVCSVVCNSSTHSSPVLIFFVEPNNDSPLDTVAAGMWSDQEGTFALYTPFGIVLQ